MRLNMVGIPSSLTSTDGLRGTYGWSVKPIAEAKGRGNVPVLTLCSVKAW